MILPLVVRQGIACQALSQASMSQGLISSTQISPPTARDPGIPAATFTRSIFMALSCCVTVAGDLFGLLEALFMFIKPFFPRLQPALCCVRCGVVLSCCRTFKEIVTGIYIYGRAGGAWCNRIRTRPST